MLTRRDMLKAAGSMAIAMPITAGRLSQTALAQAQPNPRGKLGLGAASAGFGSRMRAVSSATPPIDWIDYCHSVGFAGVESRQPPTDAAEIAKLRGRLESYQMHIVFNVPLPRTDGDLPGFEALIKASRDVGAAGIRAALTARRYEEFDSLAAFKASFEANKALVARAEPVMRKYKVALALENHKGWRAAEQAAWLKGLGSEYVGVLFDFGNNVSLCEDPMQTLDVLLPFIHSCHIKDMAVAPYDDGFLLSEVPLGDGFLDLKGMVQKLRGKDPNMTFDLETITRDPLKIPVFTPKYWATFDDAYSPLPGRDLARVLAIVKKNPPKKPVPKTSGLGPADQLKLEDENNLLSLQWARKNLDL